MYVDYIFFCKGYVMNKIKEMVENGFEKEDVLIKMSDDEIEKKYKCFLSKKCNDEKFMRIKKMFEYVKEDKKFIEFIGKEEYNKLVDSYGKKEVRGEIVKVNYNGMNIDDVFKMYKLGVKEVCKKGYIVEDDIYKKI